MPSIRPFSLLIKPASADCNLRCSYCFYLPKASLYPENKMHRMSNEVLEKIIATFMETDQPNHIFGWQGGEPTLMGIDFFQKVVRFQQKYGKRGAYVGNGIQTNASLIDKELAEHFAMYKFLAGVSIDGPPNLHNTFRQFHDGTGSYDHVFKGLRKLKKSGVAVNALVLVNSANVEYGKEIYHHLKHLGISHHQYIPCVEFDEHEKLLPYSISAKQWGNFLCSVFDEWFLQDTGRVSIRMFDSALEYLAFGKLNSCGMKTLCNDYFLVEYNGDVYPCDFFVEPGLKLGNIMNDSWEEMQHSLKYLEFGKQKQQWDDKCTKCKYLDLCAGDCIKHRSKGQNSNKKNQSWLCQGWFDFYEHSFDKLYQLSSHILNN